MIYIFSGPKNLFYTRLVSVMCLSNQKKINKIWKSNDKQRWNESTEPLFM